MSKREFFQIIDLLKAAYPNFKVIETNAEKEFWWSKLKGIDFNIAEKAVDNLMMSSKYPPHISEFWKECVELTYPPIPSLAEIEILCDKLVSKYGYYKEGIAYAEMDEFTKNVIVAMGGFRHYCLCNNQITLKCSLEKAYTETVEKLKRKRLQALGTKEQQHLLKGDKK